MSNASFTQIPTKIARLIAEHTLEVVENKRKELYEDEVFTAQTKGVRRFWLFGKKRELTRKEAEELVLHSAADFFREWAMYGWSSKMVADNVLRLCKLPGSTTVNISSEDAECLLIPEEFAS